MRGPRISIALYEIWKHCTKRNWVKRYWQFRIVWFWAMMQVSGSVEIFSHCLPPIDFIFLFALFDCREPCRIGTNETVAHFVARCSRSMPKSGDFHIAYHRIAGRYAIPNCWIDQTSERVTEPCAECGFHREITSRSYVQSCYSNCQGARQGWL